MFINDFLQNIDLWMKVNPETLPHRSPDSGSKRCNLRSGRTSKIDNDKGLTRIYSGTSYRTSLPATLLYKPAG